MSCCSSSSRKSRMSQGLTLRLEEEPLLSAETGVATPLPARGEPFESQAALPPVVMMLGRCGSPAEGAAAAPSPASAAASSQPSPPGTAALAAPGRSLERSALSNGSLLVELA